MTISKKNIFSAVATATALSLLVGCGGSGGGSSKPPFPSGIYVSANQEHRIRRFADIDGSGHLVIDANEVGYPSKTAFDKQGRLLSNWAGIGLSYQESPGEPWEYYGQGGSGVGEFLSVTGIAVDSFGRIYIADSGNNRLIRINSVHGGGWTAVDVSSYNPSHGNITVSIDSSNRIYLAFKLGNKIVRLESMSDNTPEVFGTLGTGAGQFESPSDLQVGTDGKIYVVDTGNHRIVRFDDMTGSGWTTYGTEGTTTGKFTFPTGIALDGAGRIYVADSNNYRIVRIDDMTGTGWTSFGSSGSGENQFTSMWDVLVR